eukprot:XP_001692440.1 predicted protein [Chlamydomonas reinhardtii]
MIWHGRGGRCARYSWSQVGLKLHFRYCNPISGRYCIPIPITCYMGEDVGAWALAGMLLIVGLLRDRTQQQAITNAWHAHAASGDFAWTWGKMCQYELVSSCISG